MEVVARARSLKAASRQGRLSLRASMQAGSSSTQGEVSWATTPAASLLSDSPLPSLLARVASTMASPSTWSKAATPSPTQQRQPRHLRAAMARAGSGLLGEREERREVRQVMAPEPTKSRHKLLPSSAEMVFRYLREFKKELSLRNITKVSQCSNGREKTGPWFELG